MREYSVHQLSDNDLRAELLQIMQYFGDLGHQRCKIVFGWPWGMDYPPGAPWKEMQIYLADLETEIEKPVAAGLGKFGDDDVTIQIPPLDCEFLFCHHKGLHLEFAEPSLIADHFYAHWSLAGLAVAERDCPSEG